MKTTTIKLRDYSATAPTFGATATTTSNRKSITIHVADYTAKMLQLFPATIRLNDYSVDCAIALANSKPATAPAQAPVVSAPAQAPVKIALHNHKCNIVTASDIDFLYKPLAFAYLRLHSYQYGDSTCTKILAQAPQSLCNDNTSADYAVYLMRKQAQAIQEQASKSNNRKERNHLQEQAEQLLVTTASDILQNTCNIMQANCVQMEQELASKRPHERIASRIIALCDLIEQERKEQEQESKRKLRKSIERKRKNLCREQEQELIQALYPHFVVDCLQDTESTTASAGALQAVATALYKPLHMRITMLANAIHNYKVDCASIDNDIMQDDCKSKQAIAKTATDLDDVTQESYLQCMEIFAEQPLMQFHDFVIQLYTRLSGYIYRFYEKEYRKRNYELRVTDKKSGTTEIVDSDEFLHDLIDNSLSVELQASLNDNERLLQEFAQVLYGNQRKIFDYALVYVRKVQPTITLVQYCAKRLYGEITPKSCAKVSDLLYRMRDKAQAFGICNRLTVATAPNVTYSTEIDNNRNLDTMELLEQEQERKRNIERMEQYNQISANRSKQAQEYKQAQEQELAKVTSKRYAQALHKQYKQAQERKQESKQERKQPQERKELIQTRQAIAYNRLRKIYALKQAIEQESNRKIAKAMIAELALLRSAR